MKRKAVVRVLKKIEARNKKTNRANAFRDFKAECGNGGSAFDYLKGREDGLYEALEIINEYFNLLT